MKKLLDWLNPFNWLLFGIVDPCSLDELETGSKCLIELSDKEKLAAEVWYMTQELAACGGTTYTFDTLQQAAACFKELSDARLKAMEAYSAYLSAVAAGATIDGSNDELQDAIKCFRELDDHSLTAMRTLLICQLRECVTELT